MCQTNNTNISISDSHYNVSDHVSAHQSRKTKTKTVLTKFTMRKKEEEEKYGFSYRSYFRNNVPVKTDRILISKPLSQISNLQWILQVKKKPNMNNHAIEKKKDLALT